MENQNSKTDLEARDGEGGKERYRSRLFQQIPLYTTRLVQEDVVPFNSRYQIKGPEEIVAILREYYSDKDREEFLVCLLDSAHTLISLSQISIGRLASCIVEPRQVFKVAILSNAAAIILAHNHPSGSLEPSREDTAISLQLKKAGDIMGIPVCDHLILTNEGFCSLAQTGLM